VSKYLPRATKTVNFDGDTVTIEVDRISMKDAMAMSAMSKPELSAATEAALLSHNAVFRGVLAADGTEVPRETVLSEFYFSALVGEAVSLLMSTGEVPKELENPSSASST